MKITLVSAGWPPAFGGGQIHPYRVLERLIREGIEASAIVKQPKEDDRWNGDFRDEIVHRIYVKQDRFPLDWLNLVKKRLATPQHKPDAIILFNQTVLASSEWIEEIQSLGIKVITELWDLDYSFNMMVEGAIDSENLDEPIDLDADFATNLRRVNRDYLDKEYPQIPYFSHYHSEQADAVMHISHHNLDTCNYMANSTPKSIVVHPYLDFDRWLKKPVENPKEKFTIGIINSSVAKGQKVIRQCILDYPESNFKVLTGGWGTGKQMLNIMQRFYNHDGNNCETVEYVEDMREFYDSIDVLLFPSFSEGYGQVILEACCRGVPVLTKDFPAFHESGGSGAFYVGKKDYFCADVWMNKIKRIQNDHLEAKNQAYEWALEACDRQVKETEHFIEFLHQVVSSN